MALDLSIFKDYDVRGTYPNQINNEMARAIAYAVVRIFHPRAVCICRDMRLSGAELRDGLTEVFLSQGIDVYDAGLVGTEMQYFIAGTREYDLVFQISASHNPPEYNGIKLVKKGPIAITSDSGLYDIRDAIASGALPDAKKRGTRTEIDVMDEWKKKVLSLVNTQEFSPLSVGVDAGNGMAGKLVPKVFSGLPFKLSTLFMDLDGHFPNHIPNPLVPENNVFLIKKIMELHADVGITFDGDADRMFLVDDKGRIVPGTITTALLARYFLSIHSGELVLYNAICGRIVMEVVARYGGISRRVRVGHSYIKTYMRESGAIFAGEHSGHYYFRDYYNAESGVLSALLILSLVSREKKKLSQLVDELDIYPASGEINFEVQNISSVVSHLKASYQDAESIDELDGISVWCKKFWFNIRASKTEPLLRLNVEADTKEILDIQTKELVGKIEQLGGKRK